MVSINFRAINHGPSVWNDGEHFKPERFLDSNGKLAPNPRNRFPFSAGKIACAGGAMAKPELLLLFAALMKSCKWGISSGRQVDLSPNGNILSLRPKPHQLLVEKWNQ